MSSIEQLGQLVCMIVTRYPEGNDPEGLVRLYCYGSRGERLHRVTFTNDREGISQLNAYRRRVLAESEAWLREAADDLQRRKARSSIPPGERC